MQVAGRTNENFRPRGKSGGRGADGRSENDERSGGGGDAGAEEGDDTALVRRGWVVAVAMVGPVVVGVRRIGRVEIGVELRANREHREQQHQGGGADREGAVEQAEQWR